MKEKTAIIIISNMLADKGSELQDYSEATKALIYLCYSAPSKEGIDCLVQLMKHEGHVNFRHMAGLEKEIYPIDILRGLAMESLFQYDKKRFLEEAKNFKIGFRHRHLKSVFETLVEKANEA